MGYLETLSDENYQEFLESGVRVLVLTQGDCPHCRSWTGELAEFLEQDQDWNYVRFGKIDLEDEGAKEFKKASDWLEFIPGVPFNVIFVDDLNAKGIKQGINEFFVEPVLVIGRDEPHLPCQFKIKEENTAAMAGVYLVVYKAVGHSCL